MEKYLTTILASNDPPCISGRIHQVIIPHQQESGMELEVWQTMQLERRFGRPDAYHLICYHGGPISALTDQSCTLSNPGHWINQLPFTTDLQATPFRHYAVPHQNDPDPFVSLPEISSSAVMRYSFRTNKGLERRGGTPEHLLKIAGPSYQRMRMASKDPFSGETPPIEVHLHDIVFEVFILLNGISGHGDMGDKYRRDPGFFHSVDENQLWCEHYTSTESDFIIASQLLPFPLVQKNTDEKQAKVKV